MKTKITIAVAAGLCAMPALAQDGGGEKRTRIGIGPQVAPVYPGADRHSVFPMFEFSRANADEDFVFALPMTLSARRSSGSMALRSARRWHCRASASWTIPTAACRR